MLRVWGTIQEVGVSLLKQLGAWIDLNNNTMELKKIETTTSLRVLKTCHVAHKLSEFALGGGKAPTPEQTKLLQARSDDIRPVVLPGESGERRQYQITDFSSGLEYMVSSVPVIVVLMTKRLMTVLPVLY